MRRHVLKALLLAGLTGCDAQALRAALTTVPTADGKAADAAQSDAAKSGADAAVNLLARLAAVDLSAKLGKVARPDTFGAAPSGGESAAAPNSGGSQQPVSGGSTLISDPSRLSAPGMMPPRAPEADALPPLVEKPALPATDDGWQGLHLDFGAKDFSDARAIARKLSSVLVDARPIAVNAVLGPVVHWNFVFMDAKGGFAQVSVQAEGADLYFVPGSADGAADLPPALDLEAVKVTPMAALETLRSGLNSGSLVEIPFGQDLYPAGFAKPEAEGGSVSTSPVASGPMPLMRRLQNDTVSSDGTEGATAVSPIAIAEPLPPEASTSEPFVGGDPSTDGQVLKPMPDIPAPVETVLRELPPESNWHVFLQVGAAGRQFWRIDAYPYSLRPEVSSPIGSGGSVDGAVPMAKESVFRRVLDLAVDTEPTQDSPGGELVGMPAPDGESVDGSLPIYPTKDLPADGTGAVMPGVSYPPLGAIIDWRIEKSSFRLPLSAAIDADTGKVLALILPKLVTYYYPVPVHASSCDGCTEPYPVPPAPVDPIVVEPEPGLPPIEEPVVEEPTPDEPVVEEPGAEDPAISGSVEGGTPVDGDASGASS
ncbi:MAG: hypothetical protein VKO64_09010 [Candidatus Sericytochromatia bacterium]|nr:hypothetical protein [Candidatus Sericytochromatia bacterium]